ncbi:transglycosylase SLT domain-containing protein [Streptomyces netropsis]|uniref:transglycosylase SLT domain-containing protein n=1 Tax=Streptomyces netropsis TaxID=55404 RepID=UPI0037B47006
MRSTTTGTARLTKTHKLSAIGVTVAMSAAAVALAVTPGQADTPSIAAKPVAWTTTDLGAHDHIAQQSEKTAQQAKTDAKAKTDAAAAKAKVDAAAAKKKADAAAKAKSDKARADQQAASRSQARTPVKPAAPAKPAPAAPVKKAYADNLDGWIKESLDILKSKNIPATYDGIKRNVMRESTGNPRAINDWDINAVNGVPSKGLLQIIDPTFKAYHVEGTSWDPYDPVANITASCNYAADKYGSMDNVNSAY